MSLLQRLEKERSSKHEDGSSRPLSSINSKNNSKKESFRQLKNQLHKKVIKELEEINEKDLSEEKMHSLVEEKVSDIVNTEATLMSRIEREELVSSIIDEVLGFGPINPLLFDESVSEVMVNGPDRVYVERKGKLELTDVTFRDNEHVIHIIERIVAPLGRRIDESSPMVDARLPDGSRVNAIIPPLALNGPTITIRKFSKDPLKIEDLIGFGTLIPQMARFLEACVKSRLNIVVSGGTGSGKTTTLNCLSGFIPSDERIVTIEDAAELQLKQPHIVTLETRPANIEGKGAITMRDLVKNSLRMRPDRVVIGEVRSGEALDMLQAMNTGHDGSLTTGHANTPRDMISRLETMVLMSGMDLPIRAIREQIASAIDLIVQQNRLKDGSRKITRITEVQGLEGDTIVLQDIFTYQKNGVDAKSRVKGKFTATGIRPKFFEKLSGSGVLLPENIFSPFDGFKE